MRRLLSDTAIVLALRGLYLARFGWDGCWMNYNFLAEAKGYALGRVGEAHGLPLTPLAVWICYPAGYELGCGFAARVRRARAHGYGGPVLYVDVRRASAPIFSALFEPEHRFEGDVDLSDSTLIQRFETDGRPMRQAPPSKLRTPRSKRRWSP